MWEWELRVMDIQEARRPKTEIPFAWAVVALLPRRVAVGPVAIG
jgi:hypothetical protein